MQSELTLAYGDEADIVVTCKDFIGDEIVQARSELDDVASIVAVDDSGESGVCNVVVRGNMVGQTSVAVTVPGTNIAAKVRVNVEFSSEELREDAPTSLSASSNGNDVTLRWDDKEMQGYEVFGWRKDERTYRLIADVVQNTYTDADVAKGIHTYIIRGYASDGNKRIYTKFSDPYSLNVDGETAPVFSDVNDSVAHHEDIIWLAAQGISKGWDMPDGTAQFRPYANVARADMAAFLFRLAKSWGVVDDGWSPTSETKARFSDVDETIAHHDEVWWLAESGISRGWDNGDGTASFRPYADVARADMAAFIGRLAALAKIQSPTPTGLSFADVTEATAHREEIQWLADSGVSKGWDNGDGTFSFRPYANVARADMAAFLHRLDGLREVVG